MIEIIDYGMGNLRSVQKALERVGGQAEFCTDPNRLASADAAVLPGVGAFKDAADELRRTGFDAAVRDFAASGKPLLGICLGLQLLFEESDEDGVHEGLGLFAGRVARFASAPGLKIPHMGWNTVRRQNGHPLLEAVPDGESFYFVHTYFVRPADESLVSLSSDHGGRFCAAVGRDNVFATQFHPEKSQRAGLRLLERFVASA